MKRTEIRAEVMQVVEQPWPTPAADEAIVRMQAAPLNPADINAIEGKYPVRPTLAGDARDGRRGRGGGTRQRGERDRGRRSRHPAA